MVSIEFSVLVNTRPDWDITNKEKDNLEGLYLPGHQSLILSIISRQNKGSVRIDESTSNKGSHGAVQTTREEGPPHDSRST